MSFNSNVAPVRRVKAHVEPARWKCKCYDVEDWQASMRFDSHHPGLKRCGTCGEARPETRQLKSA